MKVKIPPFRPEIVERVLPLLLPNWSKWEGQLLPKIQLSRFLGKSLPSTFIQRLSFSSLHCTQSIQLENDDSTDWIHLSRVTQMTILQFNNLNMTCIKRAKRQELRCAGIFGIWWAAAMIAGVGVFLAPNYRLSSRFHDWDSRASNLTKALNSKGRISKSATFCWSDLRIWICQYSCEKWRYKNQAACSWITNKFKSSIEISQLSWGDSFQRLLNGTSRYT